MTQQQRFNRPTDRPSLTETVSQNEKQMETLMLRSMFDDIYATYKSSTAVDTTHA